MTWGQSEGEIMITDDVRLILENQAVMLRWMQLTGMVSLRELPKQAEKTEARLLEWEDQNLQNDSIQK